MKSIDVKFHSVNRTRPKSVTGLDSQRLTQRCNDVHDGLGRARSYSKGGKVKRSKCNGDPDNHGDRHASSCSTREMPRNSRRTVGRFLSHKRSRSCSWRKSTNTTVSESVSKPYFSDLTLRTSYEGVRSSQYPLINSHFRHSIDSAHCAGSYS